MNMTHEDTDHGLTPYDRLAPATTVFQEDVDENVSLVAQDLMAKAGVAEENIRYAVDRMQPLIEKEVTDKESLEALQKGVITPLVQMRTRIEKICKRGRDRANMERAAWIKIEKESIAKIASIEDMALRKKEQYKEILRKEQEETEREAERHLQWRYGRLEEAGAIRRAATSTEPDRFVVGAHSFPVADINSMDEDAFSQLERSARMIREEAEREAQEQREIIERTQRAAKELAEREAALSAKIAAMRSTELRAVGAEDGDHPENIASIPYDQWPSVVEAIAQAVVARNKAREDAAIVERRMNSLLSAGYERIGDALRYDTDEITISALLGISEEDIRQRCEAARQDMLAKEAARQERLREEGAAAERQRIQREQEQQERQRLENVAKMDDAQKWTEWVEAIKSSAPIMKGAIGKHAVDTAMNYIEKLSIGVTKDLFKQ